MTFSREIIKKILQSVQFRVPTTEEKNTYYTQIGETLVRISNHCTRLYVWDDILEKNPQWMFSEPGEDADYRLTYKSENGFQRDDRGKYGMNALDPNTDYARDTRMFNGWRQDGNPSDVNHSEEDEKLPQEYLDSLNESVRRAIKKVIKRKK